MNEKQIANYWYMKGIKDAETTVSQDVELSQTLKDFETHFELQYKSQESDSLPRVIESFQNFLIMDGQIEIDPHDAKRNVEIFINSL
jgi:uncharacterized protein (DUF2164 family)